jgi:hypothetical protein
MLSGPFLTATLCGVIAETLISKLIPRRHRQFRQALAFLVGPRVFLFVLRPFGLSPVGLFASGGGILILLLDGAILAVVVLLV